MPGHAPVLWFTGLSGAGKSTIALQVFDALSKDDVAVEILDGDQVRAALSPDLGFSKSDRDTQVRRLGYMAHLLSKHGVTVLVSAISPYREARDAALALSSNPVEIFVDASLETLEERDTKGLYAKARKGELKGLTGVDDPYEAPHSPDLTLRTDSSGISACVENVLAAWDRARYVLS